MKIEYYTVLGHQNIHAPKFETPEAAREFARVNGGQMFPVVDTKITKIPVDELRVLEVEG